MRLNEPLNHCLLMLEQPAAEAHTRNLSIREAEARGLLPVRNQSEPHSNSLSQKQKQPTPHPPNSRNRASELVYWAKALAAKSDDLSSIVGTTG